ncbi:MAG: Flp pilus assembly complex ATPase component TadA [Anaerolineales bacterium]|nr:Flp pilus assembly complex ATPase component TadA [Anaerolineales bacterium]
MNEKASILIVDDDAAMGETLLDILEDKGFNVAIAKDGPTAVAEAGGRHFDLALIDIMMPGMDGVETLRGIKRADPETTTMIMTGHSALEGLVSDALKAGVEGVLYKPFDIDTIVEMIESKTGARVGPPLIDLKKYRAQPEALRLIPEETARKYNVIPLRIEGDSLVVAMSQPENLYTIDEIQARTRMQVRPLRAALMDVQGAINLHYRALSEVENEIELLASDDLARIPAARILDLLIDGAVKDGASDIHIEPQQDGLRIRYRIDGRLHDRLSLPMNVHTPLLARLKILAKMDTTERRRPQDGQFTVSIDGGRDVNVRAATVNTPRGEVAVLRVLDKSISVMELPELGFLSDSLEAYQKLLQSPSGMILVSGPTGSGKTTTLYASIKQLNTEERNIVTIEDPIEYQFDNVKQIQVNPQIDLTFASGLRVIYRLDPDAILVGEVRDAETAKAVAQAALSGSLVLSSVHTNSATGALFRLIDLGVAPFLVSSAVTGIINQRLVRRVCPHCSSLREAPEEERLVYEEEMGEARTQFYYGAGCKFCAHTGYLGRSGVFEMLVVSGEIKRMLIGGASGKEIKDQAVKEGMATLQHAGMQKVKEGLTTLHEVLRNVFY